MTEEYDSIGKGYAGSRRTDPGIAARISAALGEARTVLDVGSGTGSYEPAGLQVTAVEPSAAMIAQRPAGAAPVIRAAAENLPFGDRSFDAAMTVLSIHHWDDPEAGIAQMRRVAARSVVLSFDAGDLQGWWLAEYVPEIAEDDRARFPSIEAIAGWMGGARVEAVAVGSGCADLFLGALFARPELVLDDRVRAATSGFARLDDEVEHRAVERLRSDLESGRWDERYGRYREVSELDVGLRLLVAV